MTPLNHTLNQLEKSRKEFDVFYWRDTTSTKKLKSFLTQSSHDLILALVEDLEGMKPKKIFSALIGNDIFGNQEDVGANEAISDIQSSLREIAKKKT